VFLPFKSPYALKWYAFITTHFTENRTKTVTLDFCQRTDTTAHNDTKAERQVCDTFRSHNSRLDSRPTDHLVSQLQGSCKLWTPNWANTLLSFENCNWNRAGSFFSCREEAGSYFFLFARSNQPVQLDYLTLSFGWKCSLLQVQPLPTDLFSFQIHYFPHSIQLKLPPYTDTEISSWVMIVTVA
jgi:hypothetical protein